MGTSHLPPPGRHPLPRAATPGLLQTTTPSTWLSRWHTGPADPPASQCPAVPGHVPQLPPKGPGRASATLSEHPSPPGGDLLESDPAASCCVARRPCCLEPRPVSPGRPAAPPLRPGLLTTRQLRARPCSLATLPGSTVSVPPQPHSHSSCAKESPGTVGQALGWPLAGGWGLPLSTHTPRCWWPHVDVPWGSQLGV